MGAVANLIDSWTFTLEYYQSRKHVEVPTLLLRNPKDSTLDTIRTALTGGPLVGDVERHQLSRTLHATGKVAEVVSHSNTQVFECQCGDKGTHAQSTHWLSATRTQQNTQIHLLLHLHVCIYIYIITLIYSHI